MMTAKAGDEGVGDAISRRPARRGAVLDGTGPTERAGTGTGRAMAPAAAQPPEIQFAQRLAANEKRIRDRAVKKLRGYISVRTQRPTGRARPGAAGRPGSARRCPGAVGLAGL